MNFTKIIGQQLIGRSSILTREKMTFVSRTLPKISKVHHPNRVQNDTLFPWCDVDIPELPYCDFLWDNIEAHGHLPGLVCGLTDRVLNHGEVKEQALKVSSCLRSLGLKKGDVIGILLPNCIEYPLIIQGALHSGLVVTTINPLYTPHEISRQLTASKATVIFSHVSIQEKVAEVQKLSPKLHTTIQLGGSTKDDTNLSWTDFINLSSESNPEQVPVDLKNDVAILPFSSGTTGMPKGVMISQYNLVANNYLTIAHDPEYLDRARGQMQETMIGVLPMFHIFGLNCTISACIHMGAKLVVVPMFKPDLFIQLMEKHRPTNLQLVPPLVNFLANHPAVTREHLSSLRQINVGAAPSGPALIEQFNKKAPEYVIYKEGWGATECSGVGSCINRAHGGVKTGSVNQIVSNSRAQIRDVETDKALGPGERGELVIRGPHCMLGYSNNEEANKETFDGEGWMRTGDIGYYDEEGFLFIVDRMKELIKVKGLQVAPAELEDILRGLPGVLDVGVIGVDDDRCGQVPRAFIVRQGETLTEDQVHKFMSEQVSSHKQLTGGVEWVESIPKSTAGKILRKDLKSLYVNRKDS